MRVVVNTCVWAAAWLALAAAHAPAGEDWIVFTNCTLVANRANDGDSFHILAGGRERIVRLYFVDCPETDLQVPERVAEQAAHWGVARADLLEAGAEAARYVRRALRKPFTVYTRMEDARGQSELPRYFAFVVTRGGGLDERLVARGLARSYGKHADLPDGTRWRTHLNRLDALEAKARKERSGLWAVSADERPGGTP